MNQQDYVTTSDLSLAAYLMLNGFTAITCVDPEDGQGRYDFYLTHADPEVRDKIFIEMNRLRDRFGGIDATYAEYYKHSHKLKSLTRSPVRKSEYGV